MIFTTPTLGRQIPWGSERAKIPIDNYFLGIDLREFILISVLASRVQLHLAVTLLQ